MTQATWTVRAIRAELSVNPEPLTMHPGDRVEMVGEQEDGRVRCRNGAGREDWVPLSYLSAEGPANTRTALVEYDSTVFPAAVGDTFQAYHEEHGWLWCQNADGAWGWVRVANVERLDQA